MDYKNFDETQEFQYSLYLYSSKSENEKGLPEREIRKISQTTSILMKLKNFNYIELDSF